MNNLNTRHGAIFAYTSDEVTRQFALLAIKEGKWYETDIATPYHGTLAGLCAIADGCQFTHLWVMPDVCHPDKAFFEAAELEWDLFASWQINDPEIANAFEMEVGEENLLVSVTGCRRPKGGKHWFTICFPGNCQWSWCDEEIAPKTLLQTIKLLEDSLGVPVGSGPTTVGMRLIEGIHGEVGKVKKKLKKPDVNLAAIPFNQAARTIIWQRPLKAFEHTKMYLHKVDKNSDFLRACLENELGIGSPVKVFHTQGLDENLPGVWHVERIHPDGAPASLPAPLWRDAVWLSTPVVKMLQKMGYDLIISEGYQFPAHSPLLEKWANLLWNFRLLFKHNSQDEALSPARRDVYARAYDAMKDIAAMTVGLLNSQTPAIQSTWKFRPDWWAQVVGQARALMLYNMEKVMRESGGLTPVLVYIDAMLYVSDEPDVEKALPGLALRNSLGCYKHEWTLEMSDAVLAILDSEEGEAYKMGRLNDLAEGNTDEQQVD